MYLLAKGDPGTGLSNNRMSLDIVVGLAHLTGRTLVLNDLRPLFAGTEPEIRGRGDAGVPPNILDLYDVPVALLEAAQFQQETKELRAWTLPWNYAPASMFYFPCDLNTETTDFKAFRNRRRFAYTISDWENEIDVLRIDTRMLSMFSYFFFLEDELHDSLNVTMRQIRPKEPYIQFSEALVKHLGGFNAIHVRRGDIAHVTPRPDLVTGDRILENIEQCLPRDEPLVICTDSSNDEDFFRPISNHFSEVIFLDRYILQDDGWRTKFKELPCYDDTTLALVSQITASSAKTFIGSLFSTFSAMIQRARGFEGRDESFKYVNYPMESNTPSFRSCEFHEAGDGIFSWNRLQYPLPPENHSWFREWPEAFCLHANSQSV